MTTQCDRVGPDTDGHRRTTEPTRPRRAQPRVVVWGCGIHRTPPRTECRGCADQGELFSRDDIRRDDQRSAAAGGDPA